MPKVIIPNDIVVLKNHETINLEKMYDLSVAAACYTNGGSKLKLLFKLYDEDTDHTFHILESLKVGSPEYVDILRRLYFDDVNVLSVNLENLENFIAKCKILHGSPPGIDWNTLEVWSKPISLINVPDEFLNEEVY